MAELKRVLIMAGGTGGHVFPGLAMARYFQERDVDVRWLGTQKGLEAQLVPKAGITLDFVSISGIRGKSFKDILLAPWRLTRAIVQALKHIRSFNPDVVIGMGGFVSGPGGIASVLLRKPLIIHEQNAKPGLTNQWLAPVSAKVLEGFPNTFKKRANVVTVGNPVRCEIALLPPPAKSERPSRLLVIGGSLGALAFNQLLPEALAKMPAHLRPEVMHQTGEKNFTETEAHYKEIGMTANVVPFIIDMDKAYAWADMVLCRAGALTIAELCAAGLGAILVPYPYAVDDHQTANANFMVNQQAACLVQQAQLTVERLTALLIDFYSSADKRLQMAKAAYKLRNIDATEKVFIICKEVCH